jgi:hypothetical protein
MNEQPKDAAQPATTDTTATAPVKKPWETPTIEELGVQLSKQGNCMGNDHGIGCGTGSNG